MNGADINASQFPTVYMALGINVNKLGCIMLDTDSIPITSMVENGDDDLYFARDKEHYWIRGAVGETGAHATLLYGLLEHGTQWRELVDLVLLGWKIPDLEIESIGVFDSPYADEPYKCIIAHIKVTDELLEGHARLELLPHINTFTKYRPHVTLAYVHEDAAQKWVGALQNLVGRTLAVTKLNYGSQH